MSMFRIYWIVGITLGASFIHALPYNAPLDNALQTHVLPPRSTPQRLSVFGYTFNATTDECAADAGYKIAQFFVYNYITHAFTLRVGAGYRGTYTFIFCLGALFLPYFGLLLACRGMESWAMDAKGALERAGRGGALCVVARTKKWRPKPNDEAWCWRSTHNTGATDPDTSVTTDTGAVEASLVHYAGLELEYLSQYYVQIHGMCRLPEDGEYLLARLPTDYKVRWTKQPAEPSVGLKITGGTPIDNTGLKDSKDTIEPIAKLVPEDPKGTAKLIDRTGLDPSKDRECSISSSYSTIKPLIALVQLLSAVPTIYAAHKLENRTNHGYAGYQLTVIPFALMSIINTITTLSTSSYGASYMIRSSIMDEAERRGAVFDGVAGTLCESKSKIVLTLEDNYELIGEVGKYKSEAEDSVCMGFPKNQAINIPKLEEAPKKGSFWDSAKKISNFVFKQQVWEGIREEAPILRWLLSSIASKELKDSTTREPTTDEASDLGAKQSAKIENKALTTDGEDETEADDGKIRRLNPHMTCLSRLFKRFRERKLKGDKNKPIPTMVLFPAIGNPIPRKKCSIEKAMYYIADIIFVLSIMAPYLITYYLTGYKNGKSTPAQRAIVMLWLVLMQIACIPQRLIWNYLQTRHVTPLISKEREPKKPSFLKKHLQNFLQKTLPRTKPLGTTKLVLEGNEMRWGLVFVLISGAIYSIPGMLGFVHVLILMVDDNKGNCNGACKLK